MKDLPLINKVIILIVSLLLFTIIMLALVGENGVINREIKSYNDTHAEENQQEDEDEFVRMR